MTRISVYCNNKLGITNSFILSLSGCVNVLRMSSVINSVVYLGTTDNSFSTNCEEKTGRLIAGITKKSLKEKPPKTRGRYRIDDPQGLY